MRTQRDGIVKKIVCKEDFKNKFKRIWHEGRQAFKSPDEEVYTVRPHEKGYELTPFPPLYKIFIFVDPQTQSGCVHYSNVSEKTQRIINVFIEDFFRNYPLDTPVEYQIHIRLDTDWALRKISVIDCVGKSDELKVRYALGMYIQSLLEGKTLHPYLNAYLPSEGESYEPMG